MSQQLYFATGVRIAPEIADRKTAPFAVQRREGCDTVEAAAVAPADAMLLSLLPTVRRGAAQKYRALSHALLRRPDMRHAVVLTEDSAFERLSLLQWDTVARLGGCAWVLKLNRPRSALLRRLLRRLKSCELDRADKQRLKTEIEDTRAEGAKGESLIERI